MAKKYKIGDKVVAYHFGMEKEGTIILTDLSHLVEQGDEIYDYLVQLDKKDQYTCYNNKGYIVDHGNCRPYMEYDLKPIGMTKDVIISKLLDLIKDLKEDAEMAIDGRWDKGDEGYRDQLDNIENTLNEIGYEIPA